MEFDGKISSSSLREVNRKKCNEWSLLFGHQALIGTTFIGDFHWPPLVLISDSSSQCWPSLIELCAPDTCHKSLDPASWGAVCCLWLQSHIVFKFDWQPPSSEKYFSTPNQLHFSRSYCREFANIQFSLALTALTVRERVLYILEQLLTE